MRRSEPEDRPPPESRSSSAGTPVEMSGTGDEKEDGLTPVGRGAGVEPDAGLTRRLKEDMMIHAAVGLSDGRQGVNISGRNGV